MRIWIFLLPLYCLAVGSGIAALAERARTTTSLTPLLAPILAAAIAALSLASHSVAATTETGAFPDAPAVTAALKPRLRDGDRVLAPIPTNGPLEYYFDRAGIDPAYLTRRVTEAHRVFLIVDPSEGQSIEFVAQLAGVADTTKFTPPRMLGTFASSAVYVVARPAATAPAGPPVIKPRT